MTRTPLALCLVTAAALAGCHPTTIDPNKDNSGDDTNVAQNAPVALPPSIVASKIYRCADNKVIYADYLSDNKSANLRTEQDGTPTLVTAPEAGKEMTAAGGYSLTGSADSKIAKIAIPGHPSQSCNANK
jgi:crotonobetainyl-CoA:carnitine CoA-transferase CaiB-like acyl-CoA transferase